MIVQISAGQGPRECELAVVKLFAALQKEFGGLTVLSRGQGSGRDTCSSITFRSGEDLGFLEGSVQWICESPYRKGHKRKNWFVDVSVIPEVGEVSWRGGTVSGKGDSASRKGDSVSWKGDSASRKGDSASWKGDSVSWKEDSVSRKGDSASRKGDSASRKDESAERKTGAVSWEQELRFERFHCGGKGGQNVNKVETGVRLIHLPTNISVTATEERSQFMNRQKALKKLERILEQRETDSKGQQKKAAWREHSRLERGNPVRVYEGMDFRRRG